MYSLSRESDDCGDSGPMSLILMPVRDKSGEIVGMDYIHNSPPLIGGCLRVGSIIARTYSHQDWWQTTFITEIIEEKIEETEQGSFQCVKFRTKNSVYNWKNFLGKVGVEEEIETDTP
jgi:hypothetical protein